MAQGKRQARPRREQKRGHGDEGIENRPVWPGDSLEIVSFKGAQRTSSRLNGGTPLSS